MKKGAIALSANFLVIIIVSIVILALSIALFTDLFGSVQETDLQIQQQYEAEILRLLDTGAVVSVPLNKQEISRGELAKFGVGVRNLDEKQEFTLFVDAKEVGDCTAENSWIRISGSSTHAGAIVSQREVRASGQNIFVIGVEVPRDVKSCTYVYNVWVEKEIPVNEDYSHGTMQKLYIVAK